MPESEPNYLLIGLIIAACAGVLPTLLGGGAWWLLSVAMVGAYIAWLFREHRGL